MSQEKIKQFLNLLDCPSCKKDKGLSQEGEFLICPICSKRYELNSFANKDGSSVLVPNLLVQEV